MECIYNNIMKLILSALFILGCSGVLGSPLREFMSGMKLIIFGEGEIYVSDEIVRRLEPILVDSIDHMISCKQSSQCNPETQIDNLQRIIFVVQECCEPDLKVYVRMSYNLPRSVWKPLIKHIHFSSTNPRNYISTGIQLGDLIYNIYHN